MTKSAKPAATAERTDFSVAQGQLWGEQTQRSLHFFQIGNDQFDPQLIHALVTIKRHCATVNSELGRLKPLLAEAIVQACDSLLAGEHADQFPLSVWQTGSGTQTNMNVNEVIGHLADRYLQRIEPSAEPVHPNDHVNLSQSSNDVFPTAMHIAVAQATQQRLLVALRQLDRVLGQKQAEFSQVFMVGRTHLMDAMPLTVGDALSAFRAQLTAAESALQDSLSALHQLAVGGTAVGSGSNTPSGFGRRVSERLAADLQLPFRQHDNLFAAVSGQDGIVRFSGCLRQLASVLLKMANDFRLLASGPRCGFNEWRLPANEPGSSMMPGKVNPTQCEALSMVCLQVYGLDLAVSMAASQGQLQLNVYRPLMIHNVLLAIRLLADGMHSFARHCVAGFALNEQQITDNMARNLSVITLMMPKLGYDKASEIVKTAHQQNIGLAQAAAKLGICSEQVFADDLQRYLQASMVALDDAPG